MKYKIYTLGCKVNTYETNVMGDLLKNAGYEEGASLVDVAVINTCTVTNTADHKSVKMIKHAINENPNAIIIVCGCLSQNKKDEIINIDGVDIVIGNIFKSKIVEYIDEFKKQNKKLIDIHDISSTTFEPMVLNNFNKTRAFVKIQDGCNNFCTFCVIPYTRGNVRSKEKDEAIKEVKSLINSGHHEIVLTGIHTGNYGAEFKDYDFADLLNDLVKIENLKRLRISSIEINELNDRVLDVFKKYDILVDHLHIPIQSGSDTVLKRMNRKYDTEYFINRINEIRNIRPNISVTTDVIVGFPGETNEEFLETVDTIKKIKFTKLHVFPYSKRDKTVAAKLPNHIDQVTKKDRVKILLNLSKELEIEYMNHFVDKEITYIPEYEKNGYLIGHTGNYLLVKAKAPIDLLNKVVNVNISKVEYPYVVGTLTN